METNNATQNRTRKMAMIFPVITLPFIIMLFWALGGGSNPDGTPQIAQKQGLNSEVPDPHIGDERRDKLKEYEEARRDSLKRLEERRNDPYFELANLDDERPRDGSQDAPSSDPANRKKHRDFQSTDPNEVRVNRKLEELYRELERAKDPIQEHEATKISFAADPQFSTDVDRLDEMMRLMQSKNPEDPEMKELAGMLDKILDIQHPDRVRDRLKELPAGKAESYTVEVVHGDESISVLMPNRTETKSEDGLLDLLPTGETTTNAFYGLYDEPINQRENGNAIEAVIHDSQAIVDGATVKMRLLSSVMIGGQTILENEFVFGKASINGERLSIKIESIRHGSSILPVSLSAYDVDGIEGLYIPGAVTRDAAKQSSDQAMQSLQFLTMDQSVAAQAAGAGIQAAKGLFSKKVKQVKIAIPAGYLILLRDNKTKS